MPTSLRPRELSGITPSGSLTLGNYLGALRRFVERQHEVDGFYFVADLHALTLDHDPVRAPPPGPLDGDPLPRRRSRPGAAARSSSSRMSRPRRVRTTYSNAPPTRRAAPDDPVQGEGRPARVSGPPC